MKHHHAALGGTFDHLHEGHKHIIDFALENAEKLSIAIATSHLFEHKQFNGTIEHFSYRKEAVEKYLKSKNVLNQVSIFELNNIFGSTLTDNSLDSIVVTYETEPNAVRINEERKKRGLAPLTLLICPFLKGPDNSIIRSTNIRAGITDRKGLPYERVFTADVLYLPKNLREELRKPLAKPIFVNDENATGHEVATLLKEKSIFTLAVGDIVNQTLRDVGFTPNIQIIDFKTRRQDIKTDLDTQSTIHYKNEAGTLVKSTTLELHNTIQQVLRTKEKKSFIIDGEEDLLTLPAILFAPLNTFIVYGQFDQGIVALPVTEGLKEKVLNLINQFTTTPQ